MPEIERAVAARPTDSGSFGAAPGYEHFRAQIGDYDGGRGFYAPIKSAVGSWVAAHGAESDTATLRADLEQAIREAERAPKHPLDYIETRIRDLDHLIPRIVEMQAAEEAERKQTLRINGGDLSETARAIGAMLAKTGRVFLRDVPVKVVAAADGEAPAAVALTANSVVIEAHRLCQPMARNDRKKKMVATTLPERVAKLYLDMRDEWNLPGLDGIATAPLLAADGGIRAVEGYDPASHLWCCRVPTLRVPERAGRQDAEAALRLLRATFRTFPFADAAIVDDTALGVRVVDPTKPMGADESAALMALLTAACRPSLYLAPGLAVIAPEMSGAGTGKGLLVRAICTVAFGVKPRAFTGGHDGAELDKRIVAEAVKATPALFLDNANGATLRSDTLASLMTERPACVRVLGETRTVELNSAAFVAVTGNGLSISEDLARRFLSCELDAKVEDPEQRDFRPGFLDDVASRRAELLAAALTIWRWGRQNRSQLERGRSLGSFEVWAEWVRDPLLALGCRDPVARIAEVKGKDPERQNVAEIFGAWWEYHDSRAVKVADLDAGVLAIIDSHKRGRQYVAQRLIQLTDTRAADFVLTRQSAVGKWGAATYALKSTVPREVPKRPEEAPPQGALPYDDTPVPAYYEGPG